MTAFPSSCGVLVIGRGNLGFCATVASAQSGARRVVLTDKCPEDWAGGNSWFTTGAFRTVHRALPDLLPIVNNIDENLAKLIDLDPYTSEDFSKDMARILVNESNDTIKWLARNGVHFQLSLNRQAYKVNGRYKFWAGMALKTEKGGEGLIKDHKRVAKNHSVLVFFNTVALHGISFSTGEMFEIAMRDVSAKQAGNWSGCHSVAWDASAPAHCGDRAVSYEHTKSGYFLGVTINADGVRFVDEGIAFPIWDAGIIPWLRGEEYRDAIVEKLHADSISALAHRCLEKGLQDREAFIATRESYNTAVYAHREEHPDAKWDPFVEDGMSTQSSHKRLDLAESNWVLPINQAPFVAIKVITGVTFTFGGLAVNPETTGGISTTTRREVKGLFCVGEMLGGLFYGNYPGGSRLISGAVFGRRACTAATQLAKQNAGTTEKGEEEWAKSGERAKL